MFWKRLLNVFKPSDTSIPSDEGQHEDLCPTCKGHGTNTLLFHDYIGASYTGISFLGANEEDYNCPRCKGTGVLEP
ncbi:hypothetical protein [Caldalkalibacillus salinus]|uniref:hypothetical protein n=1 Tax=Caldalkalibacillus salinus TaxID=2803787 RepID=UPI001921D0EE|nr:hypothetical protein [Caldalkalibacillus salinus]